MAYLKTSNMKARGRLVIEQLQREKKAVLAEATRFDPDQTYDVFLSHSSHDKELVLGVKNRLEGARCTVYVDWIEDRDLDRTAVTPENADRLRRRMRNCRSLVYLATDRSLLSKWSMWEIGNFDGMARPIGILPVLEDRDNNEFEGVEFLGLYPTIEQHPAAIEGGFNLVVPLRDRAKLKIWAAAGSKPNRSMSKT